MMLWYYIITRNQLHVYFSFALWQRRQTYLRPQPLPDSFTPSTPPSAEERPPPLKGATVLLRGASPGAAHRAGAGGTAERSRLEML